MPVRYEHRLYNIVKDMRKNLKGERKETLKRLRRFINLLKNDKEVQDWIEKIKSHPWVKVIEGKEE